MPNDKNGFSLGDLGKVEEDHAITFDVTTGKGNTTNVDKVRKKMQTIEDPIFAPSKELSEPYGAPRSTSIPLADLSEMVPQERPSEPPVTKPTKASKAKASKIAQAQMKAVQTGPVNLENAVPVDISDIAPPKPKDLPDAYHDIFGELDEAIEREKQEIKEFHSQLEEKMYEEYVEKKETQILDEDDMDGVPTANTTTTKTPTFSFPDADEIFGEDAELMEDDDDDEEEEIASKKFNFKFDSDESEKETEPVDNEEYLEEPVQITLKQYADNDEEEEDYDVKEYVPETPVEEEVEYSGDVLEEEAPEEVETEEEEEDTTPLMRINKNARPIDEILDEDEDLYSDNTTNNNEQDVNEFIEIMKKETRTIIKPTKNVIDFSQFSIAKKPISIVKAARITNDRVSTADWVMPNAGKPVSVSGLSGPEIIKLDPQTNSMKTTLNRFRENYEIIYKHIIDPNKGSFEDWMKTTLFTDVDHIQFAIFMATFGDSNYAHFSCPEKSCGNVFINDINFEDMVKYEDDKAKEQVKNIMSGVTDNTDGYHVDMVQISDKYVFGIRNPSIWSTIIETSALPREFVESYSEFVDIIAFIDSIYIIDAENKTLLPIDTKPVPNDISKTATRRVRVFYNILNSLNSDEYFQLQRKIDKYVPFAGVSYQMPEMYCPKCNALIPAQEMSPLQMLFTRHQLGVFATL